jgi:Glu-tRNA(Gln) amidotransferase subunit E-like FAD-binding protein
MKEEKNIKIKVRSKLGKLKGQGVEIEEVDSDCLKQIFNLKKSSVSKKEVEDFLNSLTKEYKKIPDYLLDEKTAKNFETHLKKN